MLTDKQIVEQMREVLKPKGELPVVRLDLDNKFFREEFVNQCIDQVENMTIRIHLGDTPTPLERLGYAVLLDSAHIKKGE